MRFIDVYFASVRLWTAIIIITTVQGIQISPSLASSPVCDDHHKFEFQSIARSEYVPQHLLSIRHPLQGDLGRFREDTDNMEA